MTRLAGSNQTEALSEVVRPVWLISLDILNAPLCLNSADLDLTLNGQQYLHSVVTMPSIQELRDLTPRNLPITLALDTATGGANLVKNGLAEDGNNTNFSQFTYVPDAAAPGGAAFEVTAAPNLMLWSQDFDNAAWIKHASTILPNITTAPDGSMTASKLVEDTSPGAQHAVAQYSTLTPTEQKTGSVYLKAAERTQARLIVYDGSQSDYGVVIDLTDGSLVATNGGFPGTFTVDFVGDGWYRVSVTTQLTGVSKAGIYINPTTGAVSNYDGDGTSGIYIWGGQLENSSSASLYSHTTDTSQAVRAPDTLIPIDSARSYLESAQLTFAPRNLLPFSQCDTGFVAAGTTPPTVQDKVSYLGESSTAITFTAANDSGYAGSRAQLTTSGYEAPMAAGTDYTGSLFLSLSRALTGSESVVMYYTGSKGSPYFIINANNSGQFINQFTRAAEVVVPANSGHDYPVVLLNSPIQSDLTVYVCKGQFVVGDDELPYETSVAPDYTQYVEAYDANDASLGSIALASGTLTTDYQPASGQITPANLPAGTVSIKPQVQFTTSDGSPATVRVAAVSLNKIIPQGQAIAAILADEANYRGRAFTAQLYFLDDNNQFVGGALMTIGGTISAAGTAQDANAGALVITVQDYISQLARPVGPMFTPTDQKHRLANCSIFDHVARIPGKLITWMDTTPAKAVGGGRGPGTGAAGSGAGPGFRHGFLKKRR